MNKYVFAVEYYVNVSDLIRLFSTIYKVTNIYV